MRCFHLFSECKREATWRKLCSGRSSTVTQPNSSYLNRSCDEEGQSIDSLRGKLAFLLLVWSTELLLNRVESSGVSRKLHKIEKTLRLVVLVVYPTTSTTPGQSRIKRAWSSSLRSDHSRWLQSLNDTGENRIPLVERDRPTDGRFNAISEILMTRWNPTLMIST